MAQTKSIKMNIAFLPVILYTICIILLEWINFAFWCIGRELMFGTAEGVSLLIVAGLVVLLRGRVSVDKQRVNTEIIVGIVLITILGIIKSMYPDQSYDTFNYHLISQNPKFENYFTEDWAYGNFQVWGFRLADRMFYYFRYALGYRMGTILNTLILIVSFIQIYGMLGEIEKKQYTLPDESKAFYLIRKIGCNKCIWSLGIVMVWDSMLMMGTYYVDTFALPFTLELCSQLFRSDENELDGWNVCYFALLNGILIALKLTNIIFVIPLVGLYLLLNFKRMKLMHWIGAILFGLFPFAAYLLFNTICTGNPVFPYFNRLFHSVYFDTVNFKDLRFGGQNLIQKIFWVLFAVICPQYRLSEIPDMAPVTLFWGLLCSAIAILIFLLRWKKTEEKPNKKFFLLLAVALVSGALWGYSTGISRYYVIGRILWGILAFWAMQYLLCHYKILGKITSCLAALTLVVGMIYSTNKFLNGTNWSWTGVDASSLKEQSAEVFRDNDILHGEKVNADVFISTDQTLMGVIELLNDNVYAVNLNYPSTPEMEEMNPWQKCLEGNKIIYNIHRTSFNDIESYVDTLNQYGLSIVDFDRTEASSGEYMLTQVTGIEDIPNTCYTTKGAEQYQIPLEAGEYDCTFFAGRFYETEEDNVDIQIFDINTGDILAEMPMDSSNVEQYEMIFSLKEAAEIGIDFLIDGNKMGENTGNGAFLLNIRLENAD